MTFARREFLALLGATLAAATGRVPANKNIRWALSANLWNRWPTGPFTDILDIMRDTGFIGVRMTQFPGILEKYSLTVSQLQNELSKRHLHVATISFNGQSQDPAQQKKVLADAKQAIEFLKIFGADHLVVFPPSRTAKGADTEAGFKTMCETLNHIGELAGTYGFRAGLHNHLDQMVEKPEEIHRCLAMTDPKLFDFSPDTAHLHLGGSNVVEMFERYKHRITFMDYKDAKWTEPADPKIKNAKFFASIYDLGDGEIDFPACHRILKEVKYKGWNCVDLDVARNGPRDSFQRCGRYIVEKLEPIYV
jgi:sugar phosphate isomerase/epimerase